ncbi:MAG: hypothetical protein U0941_03840 [Planctomycetaceae bacterium]
MNRLMIVAIMAGSLVGTEMRVDAARGCRPARRQCAGVTHQPCAPAAVRAPRCNGAVLEQGDSCNCAFYQFSAGLYYAIFWHDSCNNNGTWGIMYGSFDTSNNDPCPTCPLAQCILVTPYGSLNREGQYHRNYKQERLWKWDEKFVLKNGSTKLKKKDGTEWTAEFEAKELTEGQMLVSFMSGNTQYFARLDSFRVDVQETTGTATKGSVFDANLGREIEQPPANQKVRDVTNQVKIVAPHIAEVKIGTTTYVVTTVSQLPQ